MTLITDTASPPSAANTMQHTEHVMGGRGSPPRSRRLRHPPPPPPAGGPRARPRRPPHRPAEPGFRLPGQPGSAPPVSPEPRGRCQPPRAGEQGERSPRESSGSRGRSGDSGAPGVVLVPQAGLASGRRRAVGCRWRHSRRAVAGQPAHLLCSLRTETSTSASSVPLVRCSQTSSVCGFKGFSEAFGPLCEFSTNKLNFSGHITADFLETDFFRSDCGEAGFHSTVATKKYDCRAQNIAGIIGVSASLHDGKLLAVQGQGSSRSFVRSCLWL